ncbi:MAG TPA: tetratricopeptide repeat protein [Stellaceae bacterium]|nr:tetratricopeptide repeat protein [Stellaceae bacterium]
MALLERSREQSAAEPFEAIENLKEAIAYDPALIDAWQLLGDRLYRQGHYGEAAWVIDYALGKAPDDAYARWLAAATAFELGNDGAALDQLGKCEALLKNAPDARVPMDALYFLRGRLAHRKDDLFAADFYFSKAVKENPGRWEYYLFQRTVEEQRGRPEEAANALGKAAEMKRNDPAILYALGWSLLDLERARAYNDSIPDPFTRRLPKSTPHSLDEALRVARQLVAIDPQFAWNHYLLGGIYAEEGDFSSAAEAFRQALAIEPYLFNARYNFALALIEEGTPEAWDEAESELTTAIAIDPSRRIDPNPDHPAAVVLFHLLVREQRWTEADALYEWGKSAGALGK